MLYCRLCSLPTWVQHFPSSSLVWLQVGKDGSLPFSISYSWERESSWHSLVYYYLPISFHFYREVLSDKLLTSIHCSILRLRSCLSRSSHSFTGCLQNCSHVKCRMWRMKSD